MQCSTELSADWTALAREAMFLRVSTQARGTQGQAARCSGMTTGRSSAVFCYQPGGMTEVKDHIVLKGLLGDARTLQG